MTRRSLFARHAALLLGASLFLPTLAQADVRAGVTAWEAGNYARAIAEWRPLALAGNADAQFNLGQAYKLGRGVPQDLPQAVVWFRRAADQAHVQAQDNLGLVLYDLHRNNEALPWLEMSAARGEPRTQFVLAAELFNGRTMPRDWVRAYALMKRASDAGLERASRGLVQMDQYIPLEQRRAGLELAEQMVTTEGQARLAAMGAAAGPRPAAGPPTILPADLPASVPGTNYTPPALPGEAAAPPTPVASAPRVTPSAPRPAVAATPAANGRWRVQLGAFGAEAGARQLWTRLAPRLSGATADYVRAGAVVRLQAGPYATRAAAEAACAAVRPQACFAVSR
jgi:uncharacterized protein